MTCSDVRSWLDEGSPANDRARMTAHASLCSDCDQEIRAALELERILAVAIPHDVDASFHDSVMREIQAPPAPRPWSAAIDAGLQVFAEPLVSISIGAASLLVAATTMLHETSTFSRAAIATIANLPPQIAAPVAAIVCGSSWLVFHLWQRDSEFTAG